jgi:hypothetical protein
LALFALTVQFVLSFGHVHFDGTSLRSNLAPRALQFAIQPAAAQVDSPTIPMQHKPDGLSDEFCAICSVIQQASSVVPVVAPSLPVPTMVGRNSLDASVEIALTASPHPSFRARAPPHA